MNDGQADRSRISHLRQRVADAQSRRRRLIDTELRPDFDAYYGTQNADGSNGKRDTGAGKGDARRPTNQLLYDIGYSLSFGDLTDEQRDELTAMWERVKRDNLRG